MAFTPVPRTVACLLFAAVSLATLALSAAAVAQPTPTTATAPTPEAVTTTLNSLADKAEALTERFNAQQLEVARRERAAQLAAQVAAAATVRYQQARLGFVNLLQAEYEGGPSDDVGALLVSGDPQAFLDGQTAQTLATRHVATIVAQVQAAKRAADTAGQQAADQLHDAEQVRDGLNAQRLAVIAQTAKFRTLLDTLNTAQQRAYTSSDSPTPAQIQAAITVHAGSAAAQKAVDFAIAQVGKPYVWAAAGPDAFDCSGLTMAAWAAAGVKLPHLASEQYNYGTHVSYSELQPGDLIFLYSDIHHVEIYIGDGYAISAPQEGENIKYVTVAHNRADFYGATRLA